MSRESFLVDVGNNPYQPVIFHYECFGWELIQVHNRTLVFSRETQDAVYQDLVNYELDYNRLNKEKIAMRPPVHPEKVEEMNVLLLIVLFILFIIPGVLYLLKCKKQKEEYEQKVNQYNQALAAFNERTRDLTNQMAAIETQSRVLFFGKREEKVAQEQIEETTF